ncbi:MAG: HEAT repeat domain-containing protein [Planctomycetota bacterium]
MPIHRPQLKMLVAVLLVTALLVPGLLAQEPASQPTTRPAPADPQWLASLVALIEGPNLPLDARRTGARELLLRDWPGKISRMSAILKGQDVAARKAVALALTDVPQQLDPAYIDPLMSMLAAEEAEVRRAGASALAGYHDNGVIPRLRAFMLDQAQPLVLRQAAIDALGMITKREAVAALMEALVDQDDPTCQPALKALEQATAMNFHDDVSAAQNWWTQSRDSPVDAWQQQLIDRLISRDRAAARQLRDLEARLVRTFRAEYIRAAEPERAELLRTYLQDDVSQVRLLGLDLVQSHLGEGKPLPPEIVARIRELLRDVDLPVRIAATQAVARFRDSADMPGFLELLAQERHVDVRRALVNGLGYLGTGEVVEPLIAMLNAPDEPCLKEAVGALGRLAERGVLDASRVDAVSLALLATFERAAPEQVALRERLLWTMGLVSDRRFGDAFVAALAEGEASTVRQAAVRGIVTLNDVDLTTALIPITSDPNVSLRQASVAALASQGASNEHLTALWNRLDPAREPDENIRLSAWEGILRVLSQRPVAEVEEWISRFPPDGTERTQRILELLTLIETSLAKVPEAQADLARVRSAIATQRAQLGQVEEAIAGYLAALRDLHATGSAEIPRVSLELLRFALLNGRYDATIADALVNGNPPLDGTMLWSGVKDMVEQRLTPEQVDAAIVMLDVLKTHPPAKFAPEVVQAIDEMRQRAAVIKNPPPPASAPASQPTSQPASRPVSQPG